MEPEYWSSAVFAVDSGSGCPGPSLGPAPRPLALVTFSLPFAYVTEEGYQAVGIRPLTVPVAVSITATSLLPELATNSRFPFPSRARPAGFEPTDAPR